jgi:hypothetical protein
MMGRRGEQWSLFYQFRLDERVPKDHLLRRIDRFVTAALADIHERLEPYLAWGADGEGACVYFEEEPELRSVANIDRAEGAYAQG